MPVSARVSTSKVSVFELLIVILLLDLIFAEPFPFFHAVVLTGILIQFLERQLRKLSFLNLFFLGVMLTLITLSIVLSIHVVVYLVLRQFSSWLTYIYLVYITLCTFALTSMIRFTLPVLKAGTNFTMARRALQKVVGRNTKLLPRHGIYQATIETLGEGFVDGFFAVWFYGGIFFVLALFLNIDGVLLATAAMLTYRVLNTLDSMVGHLSEEYVTFGRFSAKLDDAANFLPARFCILPLGLAALALGFNVRNALRAFFRDRLKHTSPNAAHGESVFAGALNVRLGGPTKYHFGMVDKEYLWHEGQKAGPRQVVQAIRLYFLSSVLVFSMLLILSWFYLAKFSVLYH